MAGEVVASAAALMSKRLHYNVSHLNQETVSCVSSRRLPSCSVEVDVACVPVHSELTAPRTPHPPALSLCRRLHNLFLAGPSLNKTASDAIVSEPRHRLHSCSDQDPIAG